MPIYDEIAAILKSSDSGKEQEVDFRQLINVIAALREKNSMMTYKYLFRVYDKNGDGVIGDKEIVDLLYKISSKSLSAMTKQHLESLVK